VRGVCGRILEVDLSSGRHRVVEVEPKVYEMFLGGRGFAAYYLAKHYGERWSSLDPLSPENPLIIATGPLTGYYPGIKMIVSGKSPQSGGVLGSGVSSDVAVELKAAGYDAIVVRGASEKPVYLYVEDEKVELRDAKELWGLGGLKLLEKLAELSRKEHGLDRPPAAIYVGPAGENTVRTAVVMSRLTHASGYGGYGAVMGSKKLKAVLVKGWKPLPPPANPEEYRLLWERAVSTLVERLKRFRQWGTTSGNWHCGYYTSSIPVRNWQEEWHDRREFSPSGFEQRAWVKNPWSDYGCPVACMKLSAARKRGRVYVTDGPDYEMAAYLGANLGVFEPEEVTRLSAVADELGLCGIQTGNVVGLAIELYERGVLTRSDVGYELKWGDADAAERLLYDIAYRRGVGSILAEGTYRAAKKISELKGVDVLKYAVHVKGVAVGAHGIRSGKDYPQPIAYAGSVQGGDHTSVAGLPAKSMESEAWIAVLDSAVICWFLDLGEQVLADFMKVVAGWDKGVEGLYEAGTRTLTLQRMLLLLGGPDVKWIPELHDDNPERFYEPLPTGPYKGMSAKREEVKRALREYYAELGWDERGIPLPETLEKLGLGEFVGLLELVREQVRGGG
jgi:aldehyde:ferredoxin oxidoreductase